MTEPVVADEPIKAPPPAMPDTGQKMASSAVGQVGPSAPAPTGTEAEQPAAPDFSLEQMECTGALRILVVDDDDLICQMIKSALAHKDFKIKIARDAASIEAAIKQRSSYHLVVLDYVLPGLRSEDVLTWLHDYQPEASVIVITGFPTIEGAQNAIRARVHDYITKPFPLAQLRHTVMKCLHEKGLLRMTEQALRDAVGTAIRERRKAVDMTLAELSRRTGNAVAFLSQVELGKSSASVETLYKISLALGVQLADLFEFVQVR